MAFRRGGDTLEKLELIYKGAEAYLFKSTFLDTDVIVKYRLPKPYRDPLLDRRIRRDRTILEARIIARVKELGVPVPTLYMVDPEKAIIIMEYIHGIRLKELINHANISTIETYVREVGRSIGIMHSAGIVHGDLTTSNIIVKEDTPYIIDFGLAQYSDELEDKGVDIHLFLRSLESTHPRFVDRLFKAFMKGYEEIVGSRGKESILEKVREIRMRGRYVEERRLRKQ